MGLKFRRRQKLFPGFYVNFSASGISTTLGVKGLNVNLNRTGAYLNTGIPGTGIYDRKKINNWKFPNEKPNSYKDNYVNHSALHIKTTGEIKSKTASTVTTEGLIPLKESLVEAYKEKLAIEKELHKVKRQLNTSKAVSIISKVLIVGFLIKWFDNNYTEKKEYYEYLKKQNDQCKVDIEIQMDSVLDEKYLKLQYAFDELMTSNKIWDKTSAVTNSDNRSAANSSIERKETQIAYKKIPFINSKYEAMCFKNQNGSDIYLYPGFAALFDNNNNFGLIELEKLSIKHKTYNFLEEEKIPNDTKIVGETWKKVNKNGTPDKRFKENYKIPVVEYGELMFETSTGVFEIFIFSNNELSEKFSNVFKGYAG